MVSESLPSGSPCLCPKLVPAVLPDPALLRCKYLEAARAQPAPTSAHLFMHFYWLLSDTAAIHPWLSQVTLDSSLVQAVTSDARPSIVFIVNVATPFDTHGYAVCVINNYCNVPWVPIVTDNTHLFNMLTHILHP
jgi:hypothetical protein